MTEKTIQEVNSEQMKERFQFKLTINDNIVCQRYFRINGFKSESKNSYELRECMYKCVERIKEDLKYKSNIYNWLTAPRIFDTVEQLRDMIIRHIEKYGDLKTYEFIPVASFVLISSTQEVFVWNGEDIEPYDGYFNVSDYIPTEQEDQKCVLKFTFMDGDDEVMSEVFDGSCYQRFVRTNIDLSNSKNKYKIPGQYSQYEATLIDEMNKGREDIIPIIVRNLCVCCSSDDNSDYTTKETYNGKKYFFNLNYANSRVVSSYERKYKNKTEKYFRDLSM